jgi:hypothetical protein
MGWSCGTFREEPLASMCCPSGALINSVCPTPRGFPRPRLRAWHLLGRGSRFGELTCRLRLVTPQTVPHETQLKPFFGFDETKFGLEL